MKLTQDKVHPLLLKAIPVVKQLKAAGYDAYIVGGAVRDSLLQKQIKDVDIATSALPEQVMELFEKSIPTGLAHGTVTVIVDCESYEITTFRTESEYENYRSPSTVTFIQQLYGDLERRDFTMNAMALDEQFQCIDPFDGLEDLKSCRLKAVGNGHLRFQEDALRMLRAVRFISTYQLFPALSLWKAIVQHRELMSYISMERVRNELDRLLSASLPMRGLKYLCKSGILQYTKEKLHLSACLQLYVSGKETHSSLSSWLPASDSAMDRWHMIFIQLYPKIEFVEEDLYALRFSNRDVQSITGWYSIYTRINATHDSDHMKEEWLEILIATPLDVTLSCLEFLKDKVEKFTVLEKFHQNLKLVKVNQLCIKGSHLINTFNKKGGPWVQEIMRYLFKEAALGHVENKKDKLLAHAIQQFGGNVE